MSETALNSPRKNSRREAGLSAVEILVAGAVIATAVLALASTVLAGHRLARTEEARGVGLETARTFLERLRADADWEGLYARLWTQVDRSKVPADRTVTPDVYYADFRTPPELGPVRVRCDVPFAKNEAGEIALREDADLPRFGLPHDLNGDGVLDGDARNADYRALPVILSFHWVRPGGIPQSLRLTTWLRGGM